MDQDWTKVWFSDEKRFNLDGPDGFAYYWHDLRFDKRIFSKRQAGGGSVMIWAAISCRAKTPLCIVTGTLDSQRYATILHDFLLPICQVGELFQQDNAPPHVSRATISWINDQGLELLQWPSVSPDLNPIENVWALLARAVYRDGRQFPSIETLKKAIEIEWARLPQNIIRDLIQIMPRRVFKSIQRNGKSTSR